MSREFFTDEVTDTQAQIGRADTKASILTGLTLAALTGGTALAGKAHLHGLAVISAVLTGCLIAVALVLLGAAIRPALGGNHGFVRWANAPTANDLCQDLTHVMYWTDEQQMRAEQLWLLARSTQRKYRLIRLAVDLLGAALAGAFLTAILTGLGW